MSKWGGTTAGADGAVGASGVRRRASLAAGERRGAGGGKSAHQHVRNVKLKSVGSCTVCSSEAERDGRSPMSHLLQRKSFLQNGFAVLLYYYTNTEEGYNAVGL